MARMQNANLERQVPRKSTLCVELCVFRLPHAVVHHDVVLLGHVDAISGPTTSKAHAVSVWMHRLGFLHVGSEC